MTKPEKDALAKLFAWEVNSSFDKSLLPPHLRKSVAQKLIDAGLAEKVVTILPGRFPVHVGGYVLTLKGHMTYCTECCEETDEP